jgi:ParB family transcriptional regulator, chromosome partitioning protein
MLGISFSEVRLLFASSPTGARTRNHARVQHVSRVRRRFGTEMLPGFYEELWVRDIHPSGSPLRDVDDPLEGLALSIEEMGLLQPIVVRPVRDGFEVIAGNRRLSACRMLGKKKVPCYVVGLDAKQAYEVSLIENLQRNNLNPVEEGRAYKRYVDEYGYGGVSELAKRIGKSEPYVSKRLGILNLPTRVQEDIIRRRITPSIAEEMAGLDPSEACKLAAQVEMEGMTRSDIRRTIKQMGVGEPDDIVHGYEKEEAAVRKIDRSMSKCQASLKVCLTQIDDIIENLEEDEWLVRREALIHYRKMIHQFIDEIITLEKRGNSYSSFLTSHFSGVKTVDTRKVETQQRSSNARAPVCDSTSAQPSVAQKHLTHLVQSPRRTQAAARK